LDEFKEFVLCGEVVLFVPVACFFDEFGYGCFCYWPV
jgi:hypothetical protein